MKKETLVKLLTEYTTVDTSVINGQPKSTSILNIRLDHDMKVAVLPNDPIYMFDDDTLYVRDEKAELQFYINITDIKVIVMIPEDAETKTRDRLDEVFAKLFNPRLED